MEAEERERLIARVANLIAPVAGDQAEAEAGRILEAAETGPALEAPARAMGYASRRAEGIPLGLVLGRQRFLGIELLAGAEVLDPRAETEVLGREVLALVQAAAARSPEARPRFIDMGCGSGNLACAVAVAVPQALAWASDLTPACAELTRRNVERHGLQERVRVTQGDLFAPLEGLGLEGTMDVVVMNPPYIPTNSLEKTRTRLLAHEPREAFDGGPYGISIVTRLLNEAPPFLKPGGHLLFEFGLGQARIVRSLAERGGLYQDLRFAADAAGEPRAAVLTRP
jgi:release factor glutamine methyltransferase